uniref:SH2 domain-containing protein n=1 Tax=Panagrolaimus sp. PS1159 TaxID=55785 RepID=A0AC35GGJ0_9BILA
MSQRRRQFQSPSPSVPSTKYYSIIEPTPVQGEPSTSLHTPPGSYEVVAPSVMTNNAAVVAALEGKCEFPKNKMLMNLAEDINERGHRLEKQPYYVGMLNADDVAKYLKKVGDFGIHASDQEVGHVKLMLTVRGHNDVYHFDLVFDGKGRGWNFHPRPPDSPFYQTVIDLVDFYKATPLPTIP